jgi:FkbM family methyltransferase
MWSTIKRIPVLKRWLPSLFKRYYKVVYRSGYVVKHLGSKLFFLNVRHALDQHLLVYGYYEPGQQKYLLENIQKMSADMFLDIGANFGYYSVLAGDQGIVSKIISFEADKRNIGQLSTNIWLNGLSDKTTVVAKAISDTSGTISFAPAPENSTGVSRVTDKGDALQIECISIDDYLDCTGQKIAVKMDVEGHELSAIAGMKNLLKNNEIFLQIESFAENFTPLKADLERLNYSHVKSIGDDYYFTNTP